MARLLVTGGAGFIGATFARRWREWHRDDHLVILDLLTYAGDRARLDGIERAELIVGDIGDTDLVARLIEAHRIDTIVHFAAESHVDRSIDGPDAFVETNILGTHSLLKATRAIWQRGGAIARCRFHQVSTDEVFGSLGPTDPPFSESTPYAPNSPYAASKASADHLVRAYGQTFGLNVTTSRCSNNYGPYQHPEKLIPLFVTNALSGRPLPIYGNGLNVRDWLHVDDHCRGISAILRRGRPGQSYNLGGGAPLTNLEITARICGVVDTCFARDRGLAQRYPEAPAARGESSAKLMRFVADRPGHDFRYATDTSAAERELDFCVRRSFDDGLASTVQWYVDNPDWWSRLSEAAPNAPCGGRLQSS